MAFPTGTRAEVAFKHDYSGIFGCLPTKYAAPSLMFWFFQEFPTQIHFPVFLFSDNEKK